MFFFLSDEDNDEDHEILTPGRIRVAWHPNGEEEVVKEKHIGKKSESFPENFPKTFGKCNCLAQSTC